MSQADTYKMLSKEVVESQATQVLTVVSLPGLVFSVAKLHRAYATRERIALSTTCLNGQEGNSPCKNRPPIDRRAESVSTRKLRVVEKSLIESLLPGPRCRNVS